MDSTAIQAKFGMDFAATERTFTMGIDQRFTARIAARFRDRQVLETCTGGGFTTVALARVAAHVTSVDIDPAHLAQARHNAAIAGVLARVTFILGDILAEDTWLKIPAIDAAFLDPDWAITGPGHVHRFRRSTTRPPADQLLERVFRATRNVALVLPPAIDLGELEGVPAHELQRLFLDGRHELYCLYFGELIRSEGETELCV